MRCCCCCCHDAIVAAADAVVVAAAFVVVVAVAAVAAAAAVVVVDAVVAVVVAVAAAAAAAAAGRCELGKVDRDATCSASPEHSASVCTLTWNSRGQLRRTLPENLWGAAGQSTHIAARLVGWLGVGHHGSRGHQQQINEEHGCDIPYSA
eukprot:365059-Chlamydomonas_euryale.AAC.8